MRSSFTLLVAVFLLAACANDSETTAPVSSGVVATSAPGSSAVQAYPPGPSVSGKQQPAPVITTVFGPKQNIAGGLEVSKFAPAMCPAGSIVVGGGHEFVSGFWTARIERSYAYGLDTWIIDVTTDRCPPGGSGSGGRRGGVGRGGTASTRRG